MDFREHSATSPAQLFPTNPNQFLVLQRLLRKPLKYLPQHRRRAFPDIDARHREHIVKDHGKRQFQILPRSSDKARLRNGYLHLVFMLGREGQDLILSLALGMVSCPVEMIVICSIRFRVQRIGSILEDKRVHEYACLGLGTKASGVGSRNNYSLTRNKR